MKLTIHLDAILQRIAERRARRAALKARGVLLFPRRPPRGRPESPRDALERAKDRAD